MKIFFFFVDFSASQPQINAAMTANVNMPTNINQPNVTGPNQIQAAAQMNTLNPMISKQQQMARSQPANVLFQGSEFFSVQIVFCMRKIIFFSFL